MASNDATSALPSVDYDIVTGRPRRPGSSTGKAKAASSPKKGDTQTSNDATSALPSVGYDIVTGQARTQTLSGTGNLSASGQNEDSMGATMLGNEIKERFSSMRDAFLKMDANRDGRISANEIRTLCRQWNIPLGEANRVLAAADLDSNGMLDFNEFAKRFDPDLAYAGDEPLLATPTGGGGAFKARDERVCGGGGGWNWEDAAASGASPSKTPQKKAKSAAPAGGGPKLSEKVYVYGVDGDTGTSVVCELLTNAGVDFERRDVDSDRSFEEPMRASGFKGGEIGLPIVVVGNRAFWDFDPDELLSKLEACQPSTPAGSGSKAASAIRGGGGDGGGGGGGGGNSGDADRVRALEAELAASKEREAKLEARVRELEEALKAATRVMGSTSGGGGAGGGGGGGGAKAPPSRAVVEEEEEEAEEAVPDNGLKVYGRSDCAKTQAVVKELKKQRIEFSLLDMDKDKSWKEIVAKNGGPTSGAVPPPVVVFGSNAWWEEPSEGIAVHFPSFLVNQLQKQGLGAQQSTLMHVLEKDVTIDEEIAERFHSMQDAFLKMDVNRDGRVTKDEIRTMCKQWNIPVSEADRVIGEADFDSSGTLDFREFARRFRFTT